MMKDRIDLNQAAALAGKIARTNAAEFPNQYPAYADDLAGETHKALDALRTDPMHARRYANFIAAMVNGEQIAYSDAIGTLTALAARGLT